MAEKRRLFSTGSDGKADYGSIGYQRLGQDEDEDEDQDVVAVRFVFRKSDAIIVAVLLVLVAASVLTTLLLGIPNIRRKSAVPEAPLVVVNATSPLLTATGRQAVSDPAQAAYPPVSSRGRYPTAGVATNCPECSAIAADILRRNGSAMDAAIAATFCLSVVDPHHTGLGGGFLMTHYDRTTGVAMALDARETAPSAASWDMYLGQPEAASKGGLSVAVPGLVKGLWTAHRMHGRLDWSALIAPSIPLCLDGFAVRKSLADALKTERENILQDPGMRSVFADASGEDVLTIGQLVKQPALADTLRLLVAKGGDEFYFGALAENITRDIRAAGGVMELSDFRAYRAKVEEPVVKRTRDGRTLYSSPPPGSGALVAFFLNILDGYSLTTHSLDNVHDAVLTYHRIAEAFKHSYAKRTLLADPDYVDVRELLVNLTSEEYAGSVRSLIRDDVTFPSEYYGLDDGQPPDDHGTSHVSIVGPEGDAVAITSTLNQGFGARLMSSSTGVILNDEMDDFSSPNMTNFFAVAPSSANYIEGGKRPLSSMCPTLVVDARGRVTLATGASGGIRITTSTAYLLLRHLYLNESVLMATDSPRFHHQLLPDEIEIEYGLPWAILSGLQKIGHQIQMTDRSATAVNTISMGADGQWDAVGDRRVDARVDGF